MSLNLFNEINGDAWKENFVLSSVPLWKYKYGQPIANVIYKGAIENIIEKVFGPKKPHKYKDDDFSHPHIQPHIDKTDHAPYFVPSLDPQA